MCDQWLLKGLWFEISVKSVRMAQNGRAFKINGEGNISSSISRMVSETLKHFQIFHFTSFPVHWCWGRDVLLWWCIFARDKVFGIWDGVTGILNQQYIAQYGLLHLLKLFFPISLCKKFWHEKLCRSWPRSCSLSAACFYAVYFCLTLNTFVVFASCRKIHIAIHYLSS